LELRGKRRHDVAGNLILTFFIRYYWGHETKNYEMGGMCSTHAKNKYVNKLLTRNPKEKRLSGLSKSRGENNIKVYFKDIC
jgi:hypothetical protein